MFVSFSRPTSKQTRVLCEPSRALKAFLSNFASVGRRKSVSAIRQSAFRRQTPKHKHTFKHYLQYNYFHDSSDSSILSHNWDVKRPHRVLKQPIKTVLVFITSKSEHQGGSNKVGGGDLYFLLQLLCKSNAEDKAHLSLCHNLSQ